MNTSEEILARLDPDGGFVKISKSVLGENMSVVFDRFYTYESPVEDCVGFNPGTGGGAVGSIHPEQIPALIDILTDIHRRWLLLLADEEQ